MPRLPSQRPTTLVGWDRPNSVALPGAETLPPRRPSFTPSQAQPSHRHHQHVPSLAEQRSALVPLSIHSHHPSRTQSHHSHYPSAYPSHLSQAETLAPLSIHSSHPSRTQSHHSHHPSAYPSRLSQAETFVPPSIHSHHPSQAPPPIYPRTPAGAPSLAEVHARLQPPDSSDEEEPQPLSFHSAHLSSMHPSRQQASYHPSHHSQAPGFDKTDIARDGEMQSRSHHSRSLHSHRPPHPSQTQMQLREASVSDDGSLESDVKVGYAGASRHEGCGGYEEAGCGRSSGGGRAFQAAVGIGGGRRVVVEVRKKGGRVSWFERR